MNDVLLVSATTFGIQAFVTLFVIMDPPGATPIFLALVKNEPSRKRILMAWQGATVSLIVIVAFAIFGKFLLDYLHISVEALQGAGGLLLLLIALELLTGQDSSSDNSKDVNVALVPLGTPLLAGPGAIVTTIVFVQNAETTSMKFALAAAIVAVHLAIGLTLMFSTKIVSVIKESGVTLLARIAGLLLAAIAVEMIVQAVKGFFNL
ncbi:MAG: NAAT family transporter [Actinobacteria bacterium]|nr:NAAT family transporter [Actinomycetota bacterium]MDA2981796.1 NAAT family transporter [Actinomycetota bacterium]MDA2996687.1 NAAT family transporter [Actinomycetota bacterium]